MYVCINNRLLIGECFSRGNRGNMRCMGVCTICY